VSQSEAADAMLLQSGTGTRPGGAGGTERALTRLGAVAARPSGVGIERPHDGAHAAGVPRGARSADLGVLERDDLKRRTGRCREPKHDRTGFVSDLIATQRDPSNCWAVACPGR